MTQAPDKIIWEMKCDSKTFNRVRSDPKFPFIVALARAVNSLNFVQAGLLHSLKEDSPAGLRDRLNSYFFASALLYEALGLIKAMKKEFRYDPAFVIGLQPLLKDKTSKRMEEEHLKAVRNSVVFHFLPERMAEMIKSKSVDECIFAAGSGDAKKDVYYPFADVIAAEVLVGFGGDSKEFYETLANAMARTRKLLLHFTHHAEILIMAHLVTWRFSLPAQSGIS